MEEKRRRQKPTKQVMTKSDHVNEKTGMNDEKTKIDIENANRLAQMSAEEIERERREVLDKIDPKILEFLRKRKSESKIEEVDKKSSKNDPIAFQTETGNAIKLPIKVEKNWLNMNEVEADKLEWMQDIKPRKLTGEIKIRVDLKGEVVNPMKDISWREGLHHHGEDEELAGYTLQELLGLSNSRNLQQRHISFRAISAVIWNSRLKQGDRALFVAPELLLQAGLIVVVRRELDFESVQSQSEAINLLHALIGPLLPSHHRPDLNWPVGIFMSFDENEAESLGEGLINHSAKDLISALSYMKLFERFRFLLSDQSQISIDRRLQILEMLDVCASHSLSIAQQIFDNTNLFEIILKIMPQPEYTAQCLSLCNSMAKNGSNLARRIFEKIQASVAASVFSLALFQSPMNNLTFQSASRFLINLLKMGISLDFIESLLPQLVESSEVFHRIIVTYFEAIDVNEKNFQKLLQLCKSLDKKSRIYLKYINCLCRLGLQFLQKSDLIDVIEEMLPTIDIEVIKCKCLKSTNNLNQLRQVNLEKPPLPSILISYNYEMEDDFEFVENLIEFLTSIYKINKAVWSQFVKS